MDSTKSVGQSPREASSRSVGRNIPHLLLDPKIHYRVHNILHLDNILKIINKDHTLTFCIFMIHINIILPYMTTPD
jgi:hypothetical protein